MKSAAAARGVTAPHRCTRIETHDGVRLHHIEWGAGAPVLFVHGRALSSEGWRNQMLHLASQSRRCIAFDKRGHGRSDDPGHGYDYDTLADDLATVIGQLDLSGVTLVGHSMGCGEIVRYLTRHGASRVAGIVLIGTTTPFLTRTEDNPAGLEPALIDGNYIQLKADFPKWVMDNVRPFLVPETSDGTIDWVTDIALRTSLKAILDFDREVAGADFRKELAEISVPTLVIHGSREVGLPVELTAQPTARGIRGSELRIYEGAPHGLMITHAERLNSDLSAFLDRLN
jgi:non-heme chloroperoxidase